MKGLKETTKYDDILYLPHPVSGKRPQMPLIDRAAQFSPFSALTGHEEAIEETARRTDHQVELDESTRARLDEELQWIIHQMENHPKVKVTYFVPDEKKAGGKYVTCVDSVKKVDCYKREIQMENGTVVSIDCIAELERTEPDSDGGK